MEPPRHLRHHPLNLARSATPCQATRSGVRPSPVVLDPRPRPRYGRGVLPVAGWRRWPQRDRPPTLRSTNEDRPAVGSRGAISASGWRPRCSRLATGSIATDRLPVKDAYILDGEASSSGPAGARGLHLQRPHQKQKRTPGWQPRVLAVDAGGGPRTSVAGVQFIREPPSCQGSRTPSTRGRLRFPDAGGRAPPATAGPRRRDAGRRTIREPREWQLPGFPRRAAGGTGFVGWHREA